MSSRITYRFMADPDWDTVAFDGDELNLHEFKRRVLIKRDMTEYATNYELFVTDQSTQYTYCSHKESLKAGSRVTIVRKPATEGSLLVRILNRKKEQTCHEIIRKPYDMNNTEMSESYKKYLENQAGNEFWSKALDRLSLGDRVVCETRYKKEKSPPLNPNSIRCQPGNEEILNATANLRFRLQQQQQQTQRTGSTVPTGSYVCHRCNRPGHFKHLCPMILEPNAAPDALPSTVPPISEIKRATGIPRSELIELNNYVPGCYITSYGTFAIPRREAEIIFHPTKRKQDREPDSDDEKPEDLDELECRLCRKIMDEAMLMNCCGEGYCLICLRSYLLENAKCPCCKAQGKDIEDMIANQSARTVIKDYYRREQEWIDETWAKPQDPIPAAEPAAVLPDLGQYAAQIDQMAMVMRTLLAQQNNSQPGETYWKMLEVLSGPKKLNKSMFRNMKRLMRALNDFCCADDNDADDEKSKGCAATISKLLQYNCPRLNLAVGNRKQRYRYDSRRRKSESIGRNCWRSRSSGSSHQSDRIRRRRNDELARSRYRGRDYDRRRSRRRRIGRSKSRPSEQKRSGRKRTSDFSLESETRNRRDSGKRAEKDLDKKSAKTLKDDLKKNKSDVNESSKAEQKKLSEEIEKKRDDNSKAEQKKLSDEIDKDRDEQQRDLKKRLGEENNSKRRSEKMVEAEQQRDLKKRLGDNEDLRIDSKRRLEKIKERNFKKHDEAESSRNDSRKRLEKDEVREKIGQDGGNMKRQDDLRKRRVEDGDSQLEWRKRSEKDRFREKDVKRCDDLAKQADKNANLPTDAKKRDETRKHEENLKGREDLKKRREETETSRNDSKKRLEEGEIRREDVKGREDLTKRRKETETSRSDSKKRLEEGEIRREDVKGREDLKKRRKETETSRNDSKKRLEKDAKWREDSRKRREEHERSRNGSRKRSEKDEDREKNGKRRGKDEDWRFEWRKRLEREGNVKRRELSRGCGESDYRRNRRRDGDLSRRRRNSSRRDEDFRHGSNRRSCGQRDVKSDTRRVNNHNSEGRRDDDRHSRRPLERSSREVKTESRKRSREIEDVPERGGKRKSVEKIGGGEGAQNGNVEDGETPEEINLKRGISPIKYPEAKPGRVKISPIRAPEPSRKRRIDGVDLSSRQKSIKNDFRSKRRR